MITSIPKQTGIQIKKMLDLISFVHKILLPEEAFSSGWICKIYMTQCLFSRRNHVSLSAEMTPPPRVICGFLWSSRNIFQATGF